MTLHATWMRMLAAEYLKLRRSFAFALGLIAPIAPAALTLLIGFMAEREPPDRTKLWTYLAMPAVDVWSLLMLPMLIALQTALISNLESSSVQWKHLYALPISRVRLYLVKSAVLLSLIVLSTVVLMASLLLAGVLLGLLRPETGMFEARPEWVVLAGMAARPLVGSLFILAVHQWLSHRWPSLAVAIGVAIVGLTAAIIALQSDRWGHYYPWALPMRALRGSDEQRAFVLLYSPLAWVFLLALGAWDARRREAA